jgi:hypothetical protein
MSKLLSRSVRMASPKSWRRLLAPDVLLALGLLLLVGSIALFGQGSLATHQAENRAGTIQQPKEVTIVVQLRQATHGCDAPVFRENTALGGGLLGSVIVVGGDTDERVIVVQPVDRQGVTVRVVCTNLLSPLGAAGPVGPTPTPTPLWRRP